MSKIGRTFRRLGWSNTPLREKLFLLRTSFVGRDPRRSQDCGFSEHRIPLSFPGDCGYRRRYHDASYQSHSNRNDQRQRRFSGRFGCGWRECTSCVSLVFTLRYESSLEMSRFDAQFPRPDHKASAKTSRSGIAGTRTPYQRPHRWEVATRTSPQPHACNGMGHVSTQRHNVCLSAPSTGHFSSRIPVSRKVAPSADTFSCSV